MTDSHEYDSASAHRFFSADCFNKAWELIEKSDRTPNEDEQMLLLGFASLWHWTQRPDCVRRNKSISYWQLSRIYSLLGQADNARRYAQFSLDHGTDAGPFYVGYAYEALARAELVAKNSAKAQAYFAEARRNADLVTDEDDRKLLADDLESLS